MKKKNRPQAKKQQIPVPGPLSDLSFPKDDLRTACIIAAVCFLVYVVFLCKMFYFDGLMYAGIVEAKDPGWENRLAWANHLSYNYYGHFFWKMFNSVGLKVNGYTALEIMNSMFSALTVGIFFLFLRKLSVKKYLAAVFSFLLAFSYAFWYRAVDAQVYPPSIFWLLVSFALIWSFTQRRSGVKLLLFSVTTGLAILAHQGNIFFIPAGMAGIISAGGGKKIKNILTFLLVTGVLVAVPYMNVLIHQEKILVDQNTGEVLINRATVKSAFVWLRGNAGSYSPDKYVNVYWQPQIRHLWTDFKTMVWGMWFAKGSYYGYGFPSSGGKIWMLVSKLIFFPIAAFLFFREKIYGRYRPLVVISLAWFVSYMLFVSWFNPGNPDYWYQHWMPWLAVVACSVAEFLRDEGIPIALRKSVFGLFLCSVAIIPPINFFDSIYPISKVENNDNYLKALWIKSNVKPNGYIVISGIGWSNPQKVYIPAFAGLKPISFDLLFVFYPKEQGLAILRNQLQMLASQGSDVYALSEIFSKSTEDGLKQWKVSMSEIKDIFRQYELKPLGTYKGNEMTIYRVLPSKNSPAFIRSRGFDFYRAGDYRQAINALEKIPSPERSYIDYKIIGHCYLLLNDRPRAMENLSAAYSLNPQDGDLKEFFSHNGR